MKRYHAMTAILLAIIFTAGSGGKTGSDTSAIFNGKDLTGWKDYNDMSLWSVKNEVITGHSAENIAGNRFLWSAVEVKDFYLSLDVKLEPPEANAGIQFRSRKITDLGQAQGYQADVGQNVWGRLYHEHGRGKLDWRDRGEKAVKPGEFNHYEIMAVGPYIFTAINGTLSASINDPEGEKSGYISLQMHGGKPQTVHYRINKFIHDPKLEIAGMVEEDLMKELIPPMETKPVVKKKK